MPRPTERILEISKRLPLLKLPSVIIAYLDEVYKAKGEQNTKNIEEAILKLAEIIDYMDIDARTMVRSRKDLILEILRKGAEKKEEKKRCSCNYRIDSNFCSYYDRIREEAIREFARFLQVEIISARIMYSNYSNASTIKNVVMEERIEEFLKKNNIKND